MRIAALGGDLLWFRRTMQILRGVAHVHSTYSFDGRLPLPDLAGFLAGQGLDFVLMSEHVESLDPGKVRRFVADCSRLSNESFLLIPGIEIDELNALFYGIQRRADGKIRRIWRDNWQREERWLRYRIRSGSGKRFQRSRSRRPRPWRCGIAATMERSRCGGGS